MKARLVNKCASHCERYGLLAGSGTTGQLRTQFARTRSAWQGSINTKIAKSVKEIACEENVVCLAVSFVCYREKIHQSESY